MFAFLFAIAGDMHPSNCAAQSSYMFIDINVDGFVYVKEETRTCLTLPTTGV